MQIYAPHELNGRSNFVGLSVARSLNVQIKRTGIVLDAEAVKNFLDDQGDILINLFGLYVAEDEEQA